MLLVSPTARPLRFSPGPYSKTVPRALWWSLGIIAKLLTLSPHLKWLQRPAYWKWLKPRPKSGKVWIGDLLGERVDDVGLADREPLGVQVLEHRVVPLVDRHLHAHAHSTKPRFL